MRHPLTSSGAGSIEKVYTSSGGEVAGSVGTGNIVQAYDPDGSPVAKYDVIVKGDNTGDGKVNILDVLKAQRHVLGLENLTEYMKKPPMSMATAKWTSWIFLRCRRISWEFRN